MHHAGALERVRRGDLPPLGRDRGHLHRGSRRRKRRWTDQERERVAHGPGRQIQPIAAHRGGAGRRGLLPGAGSLHLVTAARWAAVAAGVVLAWVVVFGGEYSTMDWLTLRGEVRTEHRAVHDLH